MKKLLFVGCLAALLMGCTFEPVDPAKESPDAGYKLQSNETTIVGTNLIKTHNEAYGYDTIEHVETKMNSTKNITSSLNMDFGVAPAIQDGVYYFRAFLRSDKVFMFKRLCFLDPSTETRIFLTLNNTVPDVSSNFDFIETGFFNITEEQRLQLIEMFKKDCKVFAEGNSLSTKPAVVPKKYRNAFVELLSYEVK